MSVATATQAASLAATFLDKSSTSACHAKKQIQNNGSTKQATPVSTKQCAQMENFGRKLVTIVLSATLVARFAMAVAQAKAVRNVLMAILMTIIR